MFVCALCLGAQILYLCMLGCARVCLGVLVCVCLSVPVRLCVCHQPHPLI